MASAQKFLEDQKISYNWGEDYFAYHLLRILPTLNEIVYSTNRIDSTSIPRGVKVEYWNTLMHQWTNEVGLLKRVHFTDF